ncbi:PEPxxWA-CTERM sorting domain-containing protein [Phenylobacterium sp.]|uniref:PEPxxWA-CTERM sorting domain-containing protein n=1 Tax=Phenylobacterium sp. TaxID=1871053 RepID=UPI00301B7828
MTRGLTSGGTKVAVGAAAVAAGLAFAPMAQAATYIMQNGTMDSPRTLNIAGIGNVKATPVQFDGYIDDVVDQPFDNLVAFCVDVYHAITLTDYDPDLKYTDTIPLTTDSQWDGSPKVLTNQEILQIGRLVNYGTNVFYNAPGGAARYDELAAVQGAIWQVVSGLNVTSTNATLNTRIDNLAGLSYMSFFNTGYGHVHSGIKFLTPFTDSRVYPDKKLTQAFAIAAVPEPAAWVMMIGGFACAGAMLRRSRRQAFAA